jgi:hypothetical protein
MTNPKPTLAAVPDSDQSIAFDPLANPTSSTPAPVDPFDDMEALRLDLSSDRVATQQVVTNVMVQRPGPTQWVWVRSGPEWVFPAALLTPPVIGVAPGGTTKPPVYIVVPALLPELVMFERQIKPTRLYLAVDPNGAVLLWPVVQQDAAGVWNEWHRSAAMCVEHAKQRWTLVRNMNPLYVPLAAPEGTKLAEPQWPSASMGSLVRTAFRDRIIDRIDHPALRRMFGLE